QRTQSMLSNAGPSSRMSPTLEPPGFEDFDFPWMDTTMAGGGGGGGGGGPQPPPQQQGNGNLDRTDQKRHIEAAGTGSVGGGAGVFDCSDLRVCSGLGRQRLPQDLHRAHQRRSRAGT